MRSALALNTGRVFPFSSREGRSLLIVPLSVGGRRCYLVWKWSRLSRAE